MTEEGEDETQARKATDPSRHRRRWDRPFAGGFRALGHFQPNPKGKSLQEEKPILSISKAREVTLLFDADNDQAFDPGDQAKYVITIGNKGALAADNVTVVDDYNEALVPVSQISGQGSDNGKEILWKFDTLPPEESRELTYVVTLRTSLTPGSHKIVNAAAIFGDGIERLETKISHEVNAEPTSTPVPTATSVPSPTATPATTVAPTAVPEPKTPTVGAELPLNDPALYYIMGGLVFVLELGGLVVIAFIGTKGDFEKDERSRVVRVSIVVTMVVGAVLIMGIFGGIERGAAAGILGTIAGYLLRDIREE